MPQLKAVRQEQFLFTMEVKKKKIRRGRGEVSLFVLFRPWTDWMWPTHSREGKAVCSIQCTFQCQSHPEIPPQMHTDDQNIWAPHGPNELTHKINYGSVFLTSIYFLIYILVSLGAVTLLSPPPSCSWLCSRPGGSLVSPVVIALVYHVPGLLLSCSLLLLG